MKKGFFSFKTLCLLIFWASSSLFFFIPKVYAGGYEEPKNSSVDTSLPPDMTSEQQSTINRSEKPPVVSSHLNWNKWENPNWLNENICREHSGNIICFRPQIAQHLGWKIPSKN